MNHVNVLLALRDTHFERLKDNFRFTGTYPNITRVREDLTPSQAAKLRNIVDGLWPPVTVGVNTYQILSLIVPEILQTPGDRAQGLKWIEFLLNKWPDVWIVIGAWNPDGSQWGTTLVPGQTGTQLVDEFEAYDVMETVDVIDDDETVRQDALVLKQIDQRRRAHRLTGQQIEVPVMGSTMVGTPVYPVHPRHMDIMPDDVTYDQDGNELSRAPASAPKDVVLSSGWAPRRWS